MMSENKRNLTEKEEYYKLITDEKSNHIETNANGAGSQCVRRKNIGSLSYREKSLSLRKKAATFWLLLFSYYIIVMQLCLFFLWFFFNLVEKQRLQKKFSFKQFQTVPAIHVPFNLSTK
jgi:hypothetical protein